MPLSFTNRAIMALKLVSMPSRLSLSHSRPRPVFGAGAFSTPVLVWPKRTIVHCPSGTSHLSCPFASICGEMSVTRSFAIIISGVSSFGPGLACVRRWAADFPW